MKNYVAFQYKLALPLFSDELECIILAFRTKMPLFLEFFCNHLTFYGLLFVVFLNLI